MQFIISFFTAGIIFAVIDAVWISVVANAFYKSQIGKLLRDKPNMPAAIIFYVIYLVALVVFVINPAVAAGQWTHALGLGALFGLACYATYDLTNFSTLENFPLKMVVVDLIWGTFITTLVSVITYVAIAAWF